MKTITLVAFCVASAASLAIVAAMFMARNFEVIFAEVGLMVGVTLGLLLSPFVLIHRRNESIFAILAVCFTAAFPVAVIAGLSRVPWAAVILTACAVLSTFFALTRPGNANHDGPFKNRYVPVIFVFFA